MAPTGCIVGAAYARDMTSTPGDANSRRLEQAVGNAIPGLVASLRAWGVTGAHWLPGPDGSPVLWLAIGTDAQKETLESQGWLVAQVRMLLMRHGVPHETLRDVAVMFDSEESIQTLLDGA